MGYLSGHVTVRNPDCSAPTPSREGCEPPWGFQGLRLAEESERSSEALGPLPQQVSVTQVRFNCAQSHCVNRQRRTTVRVFGVTAHRNAQHLVLTRNGTNDSTPDIHPGIHPRLVAHGNGPSFLPEIPSGTSNTDTAACSTASPRARMGQMGHACSMRVRRRLVHQYWKRLLRRSTVRPTVLGMGRWPQICHSP